MSYFHSFLSMSIHLTICRETQTWVLTLRCVIAESLLASKNPFAQCHWFCFVTILIVDASTPKYWGAKQIEVMELCSEPTTQEKSSSLLQRELFGKSHATCFSLFQTSRRELATQMPFVSALPQSSSNSPAQTCIWICINRLLQLMGENSVVSALGNHRPVDQEWFIRQVTTRPTQF